MKTRRIVGIIFVIGRDYSLYALRIGADERSR